VAGDSLGVGRHTGYVHAAHPVYGQAVTEPAGVPVPAAGRRTDWYAGDVDRPRVGWRPDVPSPVPADASAHRGWAVAADAVPGDGVAAAARPVDDLDAATLRGRVVQRLHRMNALQAIKVWDLRHDHPVCPHAVALLFIDAADPSASLLGPTVVAGTRQRDDIAAVRDPNNFLWGLEQRARAAVAAGGSFDPVGLLCNRRDPATGELFFIGVAVSTLDHRLVWEEQQVTATSADQLPGCCFVWLRDGTEMVIDRRGTPEYNELTVHANAAVRHGARVARHPDHRSMPYPGNWLAGVWERLRGLTDVIVAQEPPR